MVPQTAPSALEPANPPCAWTRMSAMAPNPRWGMGAALVSTDHVARSEPLWPSLCVCITRYAAGHVQKCMLREL